MPELPEVETTVKGLRVKVLNRTFVDVWSDWKKMVKRPNNFEAFKKTLKGKKIKKVWRRAKNVIFDLSAGYSLLIHQKMTGHLMVGKWEMKEGRWKPARFGPLEEKINTFIHLIFFLDDENMIALSDLRKFAKTELWETAELVHSKEFKALGPEPLDSTFTFKKFEALFKNKKGKVKQVIMKPEIIAGIGNIYSSEALWWSRIHPQRDISTLSRKELQLLYRSIQKVLARGIALGGESFADYRNIDGEKGQFDGERRVYKREKQKCVRCGTLIKRLKFGGRSAFFCPKCQTV